jgi:mRNA interferase MazF
MTSLEPVQGSEQAGIRPAIVVSREAINRSSPVVLIVPFTDAKNKERIYPSQVRFPKGTGGLTLESIALCEQVRVVAVSRLGAFMGRLLQTQMDAIDAALKIALDLP